MPPPPPPPDPGNSGDFDFSEIKALLKPLHCGVTNIVKAWLKAPALRGPLKSKAPTMRGSFFRGLVTYSQKIVETNKNDCIRFYSFKTCYNFDQLLSYPFLAWFCFPLARSRQSPGKSPIKPGLSGGKILATSTGLPPVIPRLYIPAILARKGNHRIYPSLRGNVGGKISALSPRYPRPSPRSGGGGGAWLQMTSA